MTGIVVLTILGALLVVLALTTARRPTGEIADRNGYFDRWAELHGGYDPRTGNPWLRGWLSMVYAIARPLARLGVQPDVLTLSSVWVAAAVFVSADAGGRWAILAAWVLVASGLLDNLDGAVAVLQERTTAWGYVLDSAADRVSDAVFLAAVVSLGAPLELGVACGFLLFLLEYVRARAGNAGGDDVGRITIAERPNRVILLAAAILSAGVFLDHRDAIVTAGMAVLTGITLLGLGQLLVAIRRQLHALPDTPYAD